MMKRGFSIFCSFIILALCGLFPVGAEARPGNENSNFDRKMVQADTAGSEIAPVNLIGNGNLENGYENFSVGLNLFGYGSWALKQNEPQNAHGGNAYLELNGITENAGGLRCPVMLENNVPYYISVWLKLPAGASADFHLYFTDASYSWIPLGDGAVTVGDEWTNLTAVYTVEGTPGGSTALTLRPHQMSAPVTPVYYADDWSVERQTAVRCEIGGAERVRLPQPGTGEAISPFSVKVFDQMGVELAAEATWSVTGVDGGEAAGVSITADGVLHAAESAAEGEVRITCQAQTTAGVITASCVVSLYAELDYAELVKDEVEKLSFSQISGEEITAVTKDLKLPEQIHCGRFGDRAGVEI